MLLGTRAVPSSGTRVVQAASVSTSVYTDKKAEFRLKPKFLKVVQSVPGTDMNKTIFTYEEVFLRQRFIFDP